MKKIVLLFLFVIPLFAGAQKVKIKKGKVYVDKKEALIYENTKLGTVYKSLDGTPLFRTKKESVEKENPNKNVWNSTDDNGNSLSVTNVGSNPSDPQRRGNRYKKKVKVNYTVVSFSKMKLEYETTLSTSKIIKEFFSKNVILSDGVFNPGNARVVAKKMAKNITGKRKL